MAISPQAVDQWRAQGAGLLEMTIGPRLEDADAGAMLAAMTKR